MAASRQSKLAQLPAHPAFPLVAALWFAALIGLGGLVAALIGLPQLGTTVLAVIALLGALGGAVLGLLAGRRVYRSSQTVVDIPAKPAQGRRSPISAHAELGEGGLDGPVEEAPEENELLLDTMVEDAATQFTPEPPEAFEPPEAATSAAEPIDEPAAFVPAEPAEEQAPEPAAPSEEQGFAEPASNEPANEPANETASELDHLSLLQLTRRLQGAVAAHRAARPKQPAPQAGSGMTGAPQTALAPNFTPNSTPNSTPSPANPPRVEPGTDTGAQDEPSASAVQHPARKPFVETDALMAADAAADANEDSSEDETALGETYTSLLAMTASVRAAPERQAEDRGSRQGTIAQEPAQNLATLDRVSAPRAVGSAPVRKLDPQDQSLRDALMNLQQFTRHS